MLNPVARLPEFFRLLGAVIAKTCALERDVTGELKLGGKKSHKIN